MHYSRSYITKNLESLKLENFQLIQNKCAFFQIYTACLDILCNLNSWCVFLTKISSLKMIHKIIRFRHLQRRRNVSIEIMQIAAQGIFTAKILSKTLEPRLMSFDIVRHVKMSWKCQSVKILWRFSDGLSSVCFIIYLQKSFN